MAIFISMASFANAVQSKLSITVVGNKDIEIIVDNNRYQSNDNSVVINSLQAGSHTIKVYNLKNKGRNIFRNNAKLLYSSTIYVRPGYHVDISIDRSGKAIFNERAMRSNGRNRDWNDDYRNDDYRNDNRNNNRNGYTGRAVTSQQFSSMVQTLRREFSENSRLVLAKQMIDRNQFSSDQVKYMMQLFSFENARLELAKYAYRNTTDQRNYFVVYDALSYSSSKEQLANYLKHEWDANRGR
jgi:Domain of unknown function (DUF4476)